MLLYIELRPCRQNDYQNKNIPFTLSRMIGIILAVMTIAQFVSFQSQIVPSFLMILKQQQPSSSTTTTFKRRRRRRGNNNNNKNNNNPWYGWQPLPLPLITSNTTTISTCSSWRDCFSKAKRSTCSEFCRESIEDWGPAPSVENFHILLQNSSSNHNNNNNNTSWIPDVYMLKNMYLDGIDANGNPWPPPLDDELCEPIGPMDGNNETTVIPLLDPERDAIQNIPIIAKPFFEDEYYDSDNDSSYDTTTTTTIISPIQKIKLLCIVYTIDKSHPTWIRAIRETWGPGCDGFIVFSNVTDPRIPSFSITPYMQGEEDYHNMWQKVRAIWKYVHDHFLEEFDFFHIGGDDMYVLPENLRLYIASIVQQQLQKRQEQQQQQTTETTSMHDLDIRLGRLFQNDKFKQYFFTGGPGYTLSRLAVRKLVSKGIRQEGEDNNKYNCFPNRRASDEDVKVSLCLQSIDKEEYIQNLLSQMAVHANHVTINMTATKQEDDPFLTISSKYMVDTRDEYGRDRYHHFTPGRMYSWGHSNNAKLSSNLDIRRWQEPLYWYANYNKYRGENNAFIQVGTQCCANDTVAFHFLESPAMVRHIHKLLYYRYEEEEEDGERKGENQHNTKSACWK